MESKKYECVGEIKVVEWNKVNDWHYEMIGDFVAACNFYVLFMAFIYWMDYWHHFWLLITLGICGGIMGFIVGLEASVRFIDRELREVNCTCPRIE
jgi:hypothetical protein